MPGVSPGMWELHNQIINIHTSAYHFIYSLSTTSCFAGHWLLRQLVRSRNWPIAHSEHQQQHKVYTKLYQNNTSFDN
jgi:hypothetical protein